MANRAKTSAQCPAAKVYEEGRMGTGLTGVQQCAPGAHVGLRELVFFGRTGRLCHPEENM